MIYYGQIKQTQILMNNIAGSSFENKGNIVSAVYVCSTAKEMAPVVYLGRQIFRGNFTVLNVTYGIVSLD